MADTLLLPLANELLTCLCEQLELNPDPPAQCCLRAGPLVIHDVDAQTSVDKICCPGLAYVRIGTVYPSTDFPAPDLRNDKCLSLARAVELTMGVVRCVPGMGRPQGPSCDDWTLAALHDANDLDAMWKATCCFKDGTEFKKVRGRRWAVQTSIVEQQGDCIERSLTMIVEVPRCC